MLATERKETIFLKSPSARKVYLAIGITSGDNTVQQNWEMYPTVLLVRPTHIIQRLFLLGHVQQQNALDQCRLVINHLEMIDMIVRITVFPFNSELQIIGNF